MLNNSIDSAICVTSDGAYIMWILERTEGFVRQVY